jgi:hypothetical protein
LPKENKVLLLNSGIYPFLSYMDSRTGKKLEDFAFHAKRLINTTQQVDEHTLAVLGFKDTEECKKFLHPVIPDSLVVSLKYLTKKCSIVTFLSLLLSIRQKNTEYLWRCTLSLYCF